VKNYEDFYRSHLPDLKGNGRQRTAKCPFCQHKDDLSINIDTGQCKCFYGECLFEGDAFSFLMKLRNLTFPEAKEELDKHGIHPLKDEPLPKRGHSNQRRPPPIPKDQIEHYVKALPDEAVQFLREHRGLTKEVIDSYKIGWCEEKERFTIPIPWQGKYINVRLYHPDRNPKILPISSDRSIQLFPEDQLEGDEIWLCEGELDALCAISHGLAAVSVTAGAGSWKEQFTPRFKGKKVYIVYDCDEAGRKGAKKIAEILSRVAQVKVVDLGLKEGEDLTNWFVDYGKSKEDLEQLANRTPIFEKLSKPEQALRENTLKLASQSLSVKELLKKELPKEEFLIGRGLMPKGGYVLLAGLTKEGKTILALQMGLDLVSAMAFLDQFPIEKKAKVLYVYAENTLNGLTNILRKQIAGLRQKGYKISDADLDNFILQEGKGLFIDTAKGSKYLDELARIHNPDVLFVDPLSLFTHRDINKLENAARVVNCLSEIATQRGCSFVVIHHYRKPSREDTGEPIHKVLGSSGFGNLCETFIGLERSHKQRSSNFKTLHFALRREETPDPVYLYRDPETLLYESREMEELVRGVGMRDVIKILKKELKGKSAYTPLVSIASIKYGVTKTRIAELLREAQDSGLIAKEPGKFGSYYAL